MLHAVIMAGGSGTRFWPRSTQSHPKQFLNIFGDQTMLQATAGRIKPIIPPEQTWVITNEKYVGLVEEQLPEIPGPNIIGEPVAKNTAPCIALAAAFIKAQDPEGTMVVLPADHLIENTDRFLSVVKSAASKADRDRTLVTIGIKPSHPETGYGYIEFEKSSGDEIDGNEVKKVIQFTEKPDRDIARKFIESGNFLWNSGMFVWRASTIIEEFRKYIPEIYESVQQLAASVTADDEDENEAVNSFYNACPSVSIDYGIMEHAADVFVVPGEFGWNDVGSWLAVYELRKKDSHGNVIETSPAELINSSNNLIHSENNKIVALVGVHNLAVVETEDAILICNLKEAQGVKQVVENLKSNDKTRKFT